jgi:hypothetical protein
MRPPLTCARTKYRSCAAAGSSRQLGRRRIGTTLVPEELLQALLNRPQKAADGLDIARIVRLGHENSLSHLKTQTRARLLQTEINNAAAMDESIPKMAKLMKIAANIGLTAAR